MCCAGKTSNRRESGADAVRRVEWSYGSGDLRTWRTWKRPSIPMRSRTQELITAEGAEGIRRARGEELNSKGREGSARKDSKSAEEVRQSFAVARSGSESKEPCHKI